MMLKLLVIVLLWSVVSVLAAVPPLSREQLIEASSLVVVGPIKSVTVTTQEKPDGAEDTVYRIEMQVESVEKGDPDRRGRTIVARTWQPSNRRPGWTGSQGQNEKPVEGATVRCYLRVDELGDYHLLIPNGLEIVEPPTTRPVD